MGTHDDRLTTEPLIPWILMASYVYYRRPDLNPLLSDEAFDRACKEVLSSWATITHRYKDEITPDDLRAGTLYAKRDADYPYGLIRVAIEFSKKLQD